MTRSRVSRPALRALAVVSGWLATSACATAPDGGGELGHHPRLAWNASFAIPAPQPNMARVGVEWVVDPQRSLQGWSIDRARPTPRVRVLGRTGEVKAAIGSRSDRPEQLDAFPQARIDGIEDPLERFTVQFVANVVGEDRRRVQRQIGMPTLFSNLRIRSPEQHYISELDEIDQEDRAMLFAREGSRLLSRPLRRAVRQSTFIRDLELELDRFKAAHVPLSGAYQRTHRGRHEWGRISMRFRLSRSHDPAEIVYINNGWRIGMSRERLRLNWGTQIDDRSALSLRTGYDGENNELSLRGDFHRWLSPDTRLHLMAGNRLDIITGTKMYPVVSSPWVMPSLYDAPGVMFYLEHLF